MHTGYFIDKSVPGYVVWGQRYILYSISKYGRTFENDAKRYMRAPALFECPQLATVKIRPRFFLCPGERKPFARVVRAKALPRCAVCGIHKLDCCSITRLAKELLPPTLKKHPNRV